VVDNEFIVLFFSGLHFSTGGALLGIFERHEDHVDLRSLTNDVKAEERESW